MASGVCGYSFDPEQWEETNSRPTTVEEPWSCQREPIEESQHCVFHASQSDRSDAGISESELRDRLISEVAAEEGSRVRIIGATLGDLDLSYATLRGNSKHPIDLRHASIDGDLNISHTTVLRLLLLDHASIEGALDFSYALFRNNCSFRGITIGGAVEAGEAIFEGETDFSRALFAEDANFRDVTFEGDVDFYEATFRGMADFERVTVESDSMFLNVRFGGEANFLRGNFQDIADFRSTVFESNVRFSRSTFERDVYFKRTTFSDDALFKKVTFESGAYYQSTEFFDEASFSGATFHDVAKFRAAEFQAETSISYARFTDDVFFPSVEFGGYTSFYDSDIEGDIDFRDSSYDGTARFDKAAFERVAYFDRAHFEDAVQFQGCVFEDMATFESTKFDSDVDMTESSFEEVHLADLVVPREGLTVDLRNASLYSGRLVQTDESPVHYDLENGLLGDVDVGLPSTGGNIFDHIHIFRTEFDNFDFSNYRNDLAPNWYLHRFTGEVLGTESNQESDNSTGDEEPTSSLLRWVRSEASRRDKSELETTYLKAKNGASDVGDSQAASKFFIREMQYRRQTHGYRALSGAYSLLSRLKSCGLWASNYFFSITCGYGEKPYRTLFTSGVIVVLYGVLFRFMLEERPYDSGFGDFILSIESFTTLVIGGSPSITDPAVRFVADTEGFFGAFFIALFVFALTRTIHR